MRGLGKRAGRKTTKTKTKMKKKRKRKVEESKEVEEKRAQDPKKRGREVKKKWK
jgi:hypothetical protein